MSAEQPTDPGVVTVLDGDVTLTIERGVATIRLDRGRLNPLSFAVQDALGQAAAVCSDRDDIASVVITGGASAFAAGADIKEMIELDHAGMVARSSRLHAAFAAVSAIPKPVVAAVNGYALGGGCELALCADVRFAADDATLGQPEIALGIIPGAGATQRLTRLIGPARAKELIFTGRQVSADEALSIGLVDRIVPAAQTLSAATEWAQQFVDGPRLALRAAKEAIDRGGSVDLATGLEIERAQFAALFATEDRMIGMRAFLDRTEPRFTGH